VLRAGAASLADLGTHDLKLRCFLWIGLLAALIVAMRLFVKARGAEPTGLVGADGRWRSLPATNASY
jgi:hypothetical protein